MTIRPVSVAIALAGAIAMLLAGQSRAQESIEQEEATPSSVHQSLNEIERIFRPPPPPRIALFPQLREQLKYAPPFFRDSQLDVNLRSYYRNKTSSVGDKNEAWAGGGSVTFRSGWLLDFMSMGTAFYTSQPLYAPKDRDGTDLLKPGQQGYSALGQLYARFKVTEANYLTVGRYILDTPYISRDDGKMSPNTFQGYVLQGTAGGGDNQAAFRYGAGYIDKIKEKNSDAFVSMSQSAGANVDRGVAAAGALYTAGQFSFGAIDYYSNDIINIAYGETKYTTGIPGWFDVLFGAQYVDQRSVGADLLTGSGFSTNEFGARAELGRDGAILTFAYSKAGAGAKLQNPWSGNPFYTSTIVAGFKNAGEQALVAKLSYDFTGVGLEGVTAYTLYARGWTNAIAAGAPLTEDEFDIDLQWRPRSEPLRGLWLRSRCGFSKVDQGGNLNHLRDCRLIANYDFSIY
jgi:outer membrane porin, OprD family